MSSIRQSMKHQVRGVIDRVMLPYVDRIVEGRRSDEPGSEMHSRRTDQVRSPGATSDYFHMTTHELRTMELERVPKGARRALSVGAQGRWYFDWFEAAVGTVDEHIGLEAFEPKPDDLPDYVTWIPDTADQMHGVGDASVDLVYAGQTSEHLWAHELTGFLLEAHRVLRDDGLLVLDSPNLLVTEHLHWSHGGHTIELSAGEMTELLDLAGFEVMSSSGIWGCVVNGVRLELEEGIDDPVTFTRRVAGGHDAPDDCFIWWINARRRDEAPRPAELSTRVDELFAAHWNTRVCRGLFPSPGATRLDIPAASSGRLGETLPFPLHAGTWTIGATLAAGEWRDLQGFVVEIAAPGDNVVHRLSLDDATLEGPTATWRVEQPQLMFALSIRVDVERADRAAALQLPLDVHVLGR